MSDAVDSRGVKRPRQEEGEEEREGASSLPQRKEKPASQKPTSAKDGDSANAGKTREVAVIGNYSHYYGYRYGPKTGSGSVSPRSGRKKGPEDPRLKYLPRELFQGRECLDIGCNSGRLTITLTNRYRPKVMIGMDADSSLIEQARQFKNGCKNPYTRRVLSYFVEDFVERPEGREMYDTITCLSVTKWIQLTKGDEGVRTLFRKAYSMLRDEVKSCGERNEFGTGVFILEPQPWKSYRRRSKLTPEMQANYAAIQMHPEDFVPFLLKEVGFARVVKLYDPPTVHADGTKVVGFEQRPILAFLKKDSIPESLPSSEPTTTIDDDAVKMNDEDIDDDAPPEEVPFQRTSENI